MFIIWLGFAGLVLVGCGCVVLLIAACGLFVIVGYLCVLLFILCCFVCGLRVVYVLIWLRLVGFYFGVRGWFIWF